jgi:hypothetical protein
VAALVAVEPLGPSTVAIPRAYDPPVSAVDELRLEPLPPAGVDLGVLSRLPRVLQAEPARRLRNLGRVRIVLVTSDDPRFGVLNADTAAYLRQAGCTVEEIRRSDHGVHGNGHFMTLESNNDAAFAPSARPRWPEVGCAIAAPSPAQAPTFSRRSSARRMISRQRPLPSMPAWPSPSSARLRI